MNGPEKLPSDVVARLVGKPKRKQGERYGHVTYKGEYSYAGATYRINSAKSGCHTLILQRIIEQTTAMLAVYRRVLFVRVDLHHRQPEPTNQRLSAFLKSARDRAQRYYRTQHVGYLWVREQDKANSQHYHLILMVDGDKVAYPARLLDSLKEIWERLGGTLSIPCSSYIFIDSPERVTDAVYRASYLAKARGKGYRPDGVRDFDCSRLKLPPV